MADKKKGHRFRLTKQSRTASMGDMLLSIFTDKPKVAAVEKEVDAEALTSQERISRMLHSCKPQSQSPGTCAQLFEHFIVVGLRVERSEETEGAASVGEEPQILYHYPEEKEYNIPGVEDFCFPNGCALQRLDHDDDMSEILALRHSQWQDYLKHPEDSFTFLFTAEDGTVYYGSCVQKTELVERGDSGLVGTTELPEGFYATTRRCYCVISRFPFFRLHMDFLYSLFAVEHLERLQAYAPSSMTENDQVAVFLRRNSISERPLARSSRAIQSQSDLALPVLRASAPEGSRDDGEEDAVGTASTTGTEEHEHTFSDEALDRSDEGHSNASSSECGSPSESSPPRLGRTVSENSPRHSVAGATSSTEMREAPAPDPPRSHDNDESAPDWIQSPSTHRRSRTVHHFQTSPKSRSPGDMVSSAGVHRIGTPPGTSVLLTEQQPVKAALHHYLHLKVPDPGSWLTFKTSKYLNPITFYRPYFDVEFELILEWGLSIAFKALRMKTIFYLLRCILLEKKIAIVCPNLRVLSAIVCVCLPTIAHQNHERARSFVCHITSHFLALPALVRPFEYQSVSIPILPEKMYSMLEAPVPFLVGITSMPPLDFEGASEIVYVNVSTNEISFGETLPSLPGVQELKKRCEPLFRKLSRMFGKSMPYRTTKEQFSLVRDISGAIKKYLEALFSDFHKYTIRDLTDSAKPITVFMKESFLVDVPEVEFLEPFLESRIFFQYCDRVLRLRDESNAGAEQ